MMIALKEEGGPTGSGQARYMGNKEVPMPRFGVCDEV